MTRRALFALAAAPLLAVLPCVSYRQDGPHGTLWRVTTFREGWEQEPIPYAVIDEAPLPAGWSLSGVRNGRWRWRHATRGSRGGWFRVDGSQVTLRVKRSEEAG